MGAPQPRVLVRKNRYCILVSCFVVVLLIGLASLYQPTRPAQDSAVRGPHVGYETEAEASDRTEEKSMYVPTLGPGSSPKKSDEAYVTLQYGNFFLATRVLGQSLRDSGTTRDMVVMCMSDVPTYQREILKKEGWIVKSVDYLPKKCAGGHGYTRQFIKIEAWLLTEYRRVIWIDSDAIVLKNIDGLFNCGEFCATYRHSDLFNSGVLVLKPSVDTFKKMCISSHSIDSYDNADQGFLNVFYESMKKAPMCSPEENATKQELPFQRLPSEYNGDVAIFYLVNKWRYLDTDEPYVLHYTLGPVKPWYWWSYPLFPLNWKWKALQDKLPPTNLNEPSLNSWRSWFPLILLLAIGLSTKIWCRHYTPLLSNTTLMIRTPKLVSPVGAWCVKLFPTLTLVLACRWAFFIVPMTMNPLAGWTQYGTWILTLFSLPFSAYCYVAYVIGMHNCNGHLTTNHLVPTKYQESNESSCNSTTTNSLRVVMESVVWLVFGVFIFYMQYAIPSSLLTMQGRSISFIGLGLANFVLCYSYGKRLLELCYKLGLATPRNTAMRM